MQTNLKRRSHMELFSRGEKIFRLRNHVSHLKEQSRIDKTARLDSIALVIIPPSIIMYSARFENLPQKRQYGSTIRQFYQRLKEYKHYFKYRITDKSKIPLLPLLEYSQFLMSYPHLYTCYHSKH